MTVVVTVKHLSGDNKQEVNVSFGEQAEGYKRCIGAASSDPFQENDPQATVRLLIAAAMQVLDNVVPHEPNTVSYTHLTLPTIYSV